MKHAPPGQVEQRFLQLLIFLIPSNLFFHLIDYSAFIRGRLVDYLLPKVYLTDILIWSLLTLFVFRCAFSIDFIAYFDNAKKYWLVLIFLVYLLVISITSLAPIAGASYWLKLVQFGIFIWYLHQNYTLQRYIQVAYWPVVLGLIFQSVLGVYQFIFQSPLTGFIPLGEVFDPRLNTVSSFFFGIKFFLPYGSTPHPNVFAATITFYTLLLFVFCKYNPNLAYISVIKYFSIGFLITIIMLSQSFSALSGILLCSLLYLYISNIFSSVRSSLLFTSSLLFLLLLFAAFYQTTNIIDLYSITRRYQLFVASLDIIKENIFTGVGLNNFIPAVNQSSSITDSAIYLQPVHNIYLLWLAETGIIGLITLVWLVVIFLNRFTSISRRFYLAVPLLFILWVGLFDHFPLTLQQGLLMLTLAISLMSLSGSKQQQ